MKNTPEQELRNILQFCWSYEVGVKDTGKDYKALKNYIQKRLKELEKSMEKIKGYQLN